MAKNSNPNESTNSGGKKNVLDKRRAEKRARRKAPF